MNRGHRCDALTVILFFKFFAHFPFTVLKTVSFPEEFFSLLFWVPGRYGLINTLLSSSHHFANKHAPSPLLPYFYSHDKRKRKRMQRFFSIFFRKTSLFSSGKKKNMLCLGRGGGEGTTRNGKYLKILTYSGYLLSLTSYKRG